MYRLHRASADAARRAGDSAGAARDLAMAATAVYRFAGVFARLPSRDEATALLAAARELAGDDPAAQAAVARAQCGALADRFISEFSPEFSSEQAGLAPELTAMATRAVELARRTGDPLTECTALDALTRAQYLTGDTPAAAATARHRIHLLSSVPATPARTYELVDALVMAANTSIGAGDISGARRWGRQLRDLPSLAEVGHFATSWLLLAEALAGNVADVLTGSRRFLDGWTRSGRVQAPRLALAAAAVAMIHGLRGDDDARGEWLEIVDELGVTPELRAAGYGRIFDAIVLLHRGQAKQALEQLAAEPDELRMWVARVWRPWYAALRAEAAALAGHPDARRLIVAVRSMVVGNPVADAMVDRVEALLDDDRDRLLGAAAVFDAAGCRYQWARTLRLAGGDDAATGAAALTDLGLAPMSAKTEA
jgi:hypothetical protein